MSSPLHKFKIKQALKAHFFELAILHTNMFMFLI